MKKLSYNANSRGRSAFFCGTPSGFLLIATMHAYNMCRSAFNAIKHMANVLFML